MNYIQQLFISCVLTLSAALAPAQTAGTFIATGSLITARAGHTATLLHGGKVLIAGGIPNDWPDVPLLATAELYDPITRTFAPTGNMTAGRAQHTATLLPDGRVLIAAGSGDLTAEVYDPSTGAFTATGDMVAHPYDYLGAAAPLQDGRVFIAGSPTAQLYDPVTGTFTATGPYASHAPSIVESATLLASGKVLLTGAFNICYEPQCADPGTGWAELYDPIADTFTPAGSMNFWNATYAATLLASGKVLLVGSDFAQGIPSTAELFEPSEGTFTLIHRSSASHGYGAATLLPDGTALITGGLVPGGNEQYVSELYVEASGGFSSAGNMITARLMHTSTLLPEGTVLIAGGIRPDGSSAELYHPTVLVSAPLLFSLSGNGRGQGAIWHAASGVIASPGNPSVAGEILSMYTKGLGGGSIIPPQVAIGGRSAEVLFFGDAPGYPGFNQVNVRVPNGVPRPAVPVRLTYLGRSSNAVTIGIQ